MVSRLGGVLILEYKPMSCVPQTIGLQITFEELFEQLSQPDRKSVV